MRSFSMETDSRWDLRCWDHSVEELCSPCGYAFEAFQTLECGLRLVDLGDASSRVGDERQRRGSHEERTKRGFLLDFVQGASWEYHVEKGELLRRGCVPLLSEKREVSRVKRIVKRMLAYSQGCLLVLPRPHEHESCCVCLDRLPLQSWCPVPTKLTHVSEMSQQVQREM